MSPNGSQATDAVNIEQLIAKVPKAVRYACRFYNFVSIDGGRLPIIQGLRAQTTDKKVADPLEEALKHPKINDRQK